MEKKVMIYYYDGASEPFTLNLETVCPHCDVPVDPMILRTQSKFLKNEKQGTFSVLIACTNNDCQKYHIQAFKYEKDGYYEINSIQKIFYSYKPVLKNTLPETVNNTFPAFKVIYEQSLEAESQGLDQIAGIGFRKSIEFLIKEYVIHQDPSSSEEVKTKFLGKVINDNLSEFPKIQALAKAAVWIGNDETHFVRVHDDKDIQDMKEFLTAAALFISAELKVDEAIEFTNRSKQ